MGEEHEVFRPGANVLAYHGPLVYEAKVLKYHEKSKLFVEVGEDKSELLDMNRIPGFLFDKNAYFLHYKGWNNKWDEWVSSERVLEFNDDNLGLSRELRNARKKTIDRLDSGREVEAEVAEKKAKRGKKRAGAPNGQSADSAENGKSGPGRKKQKSDAKHGYEVMIPFKPRLKSILVDDWELVTKDRKLVNLETIVSVERILDEYSQWRKTIEEAETHRSTEEAMNGLRLYFDSTLSVDLLYRFERLQYSNLLTLEPTMVPSQRYGLEHLLRLLVTLPARLSQVRMDTISINILLSHVKRLLGFLDENLDIFGSSYMNTSPQYDRIARGQ